MVVRPAQMKRRLEILLAVELKVVFRLLSPLGIDDLWQCADVSTGLGHRCIARPGILLERLVGISVWLRLGCMPLLNQPGGKAKQIDMLVVPDAETGLLPMA